MERKAARSLHELIGRAIVRGDRVQQQSRVAVEQVHASSAALARTVAAVERGRTERALAAGLRRTPAGTAAQPLTARHAVRKRTGGCPGPGVAG